MKTPIPELEQYEIAGVNAVVSWLEKIEKNEGASSPAARIVAQWLQTDLLEAIDAATDQHATDNVEHP